MTDTDEFPNLTEFLQDAQQNDQIEISDGVQQEILKLITTYDQQKDNKNNGEIYKILGELENFQNENKNLKEDLQRKKTIVFETNQKNQQLQESIKNNKIQLQLINEENEIKILELNEKIALLERNNQYLNQQVQDKEQQIIQSHQEFNEEILNFDELKNENYKFKQKLQEKENFYDQQVESLQQALKDKKQECENLRINLKQTTKKWHKLKQAVAFLKQSHKGDEQIIKSLKRQIEQSKDDCQIYKDGSEKRFKQDDQMIFNLVQMIQKQQFDTKKLDELINKFDKRKVIFKISNQKENKLTADAIDKIQEYQIDGLDDSNINFDQDHPDIIQNETQQTIRVSHDNYDLSQYELNESIDFNNLQPEPSKRNIEIIQQPIIDIIQKPQEKKKNDVEELKKKLQLEIESKIKFSKFQTQRNLKGTLSISNPMKFQSYAMGQKKKDQDDTLKHNYQQPNMNFLDELNIPLSEFKQGIEMLEELCNNPDKNPTTFVIQNFDKKQMIDKYEKTQKQNLRKYLSLFIKLFLYQINYLEGKISTLTYNNSYLDLQLQNKKDELNYLLKVFLDKNAKNQEFLNSANKKLIRLRKRNKRRLQLHSKKNHKNIQQIQQYNKDSNLKNESILKNNINKKQQDSELSLFKKNELNKTPLLSEEHSIDQQQKNDQQNKDNFLTKVTNLFNQFLNINYRKKLKNLFEKSLKQNFIIKY